MMDLTTFNNQLQPRFNIKCTIKHVRGGIDKYALVFICVVHCFCDDPSLKHVDRDDGEYI